MKSNNVTVQEIADALGISRNTVSKVINGHHVPHNTKDMVINKAIELGYKGFNQIKTIEETKKIKLLLLTGQPLTSLEFFLSIVRGIEERIKKYNIDFFQYTINKNSSKTDLDNYTRLLEIDGIIAIELFDKNDIDDVLKLEIPVCFIDCVTYMSYQEGNYDVILMEAMQTIHKLVAKLVEGGARTFGFIGDKFHCQGFYERYLGLKEALYNNKILLREKDCILDSDNSPYGDVKWLTKKLAELDKIPDVLFCANDSIAIPLLQALKNLNKKIPDDVQVIGYDNQLESTMCKPTLTTINIDKNKLGQEVIHILLQRIKNSLIPNRITYLWSNIIYRNSTK